MKNLLVILMSALIVGATSAQAQAASLADARRSIDKVIANPDVMKATMRTLSAADQKQFLADVNKAISDMPASTEEKTAKFLNVNSAALRGAARGNMVPLLAEVFATVSPEALTVINERFASDLFNRSADANTTYTDAQFTKIAQSVMTNVAARCEEADRSAPRATFAILMLVRASNGSPADLADKLIDTLKDDEAKEMARSEWVPAALGKDRPKSYEPLLASADAGNSPDVDFVLKIAGPQYNDILILSLLASSADPEVLIKGESPFHNSLPLMGEGVGNELEPKPYQGQTTH